MINAIEEVVREVYVQVRDREEGFCTCAQCEDDVIRHTMNHLRPRYVGTTVGSAITRVSLSLEQARAEVAVVLLDAMRRVAQNPLHNDSSS
ncbi:MAG TPA: late competence development ComFB family protein [Gemmatimonadaceae bacterium]|nr:late competence development ComFB family protein [Gemmatimonadaceae bacterium]